MQPFGILPKPDRSGIMPACDKWSKLVGRRLNAEGCPAVEHTAEDMK